MVWGEDFKLHIFVLNVALSEHGINDNMSVTKCCVKNTSPIALTNVPCRNFYFRCRQTFLLNVKSSQYEVFENFRKLNYQVVTNGIKSRYSVTHPFNSKMKPSILLTLLYFVLMSVMRIS